MGRWAQRHRRGGLGNPEGSGTGHGSPVLEQLGYDTLVWTWDGDDPYYWNLARSSDDVEWAEWFQSLDGTLRAFTPVDTGYYYRITGTNADNEAVTGMSNTVHMV